MKSQRKTGKEKETNWESMRHLKNSNHNENGKLSISKTLNIKRLNSPIKRHRVAQWKKKKSFNYMLTTKHSHQLSDRHRLKVSRWKNMPHKNGNKRVGTLI